MCLSLLRWYPDSSTEVAALSKAEEAGREEIDEEHENKGSADDSTGHQETRSNAGEKGKVSIRGK